jgi:tetratricopeptide (TPR) repeat protein
LSPKACQLLLLLLENVPRALSKAEIQDAIWPGTFVTEASVANVVSELRRALGSSGDSFIKTVHGFGYRFDSPPPETTVAPAGKTLRMGWLVGACATLIAAIAIGVWTMRHRVHAEKSISKPAFEEYLSVRSSLAGIERGGSENRRNVLARLDAILKREPNFARALATRAYVEGAFTFWEPSTRWYSASIADADRALALDPTLVEPHLARAFVLYSAPGGWKIFDALSELRLASSMAPAHDVAHQRLARLYRHLGWFDELARENDTIQRLNPQAAELPRLRALRFLDGGDCPAARSEFAKARPIAGDPFPLWQQVAMVEIQCGDAARAREQLETEYARTPVNAPERPLTAALLALARFRAGVADVSDLERDALSTDQRIGHFHHVLVTLADLHSLQGDASRSIEYLTRAADEGMPCVLCFEHDPFLANLRKNARFRALLADLKRREAPYRQR